MDKKIMDKLEALVSFLKKEYENKIDVSIIKLPTPEEDKLSGNDGICTITAFNNRITDHNLREDRIVVKNDKILRWSAPLPGGWNILLNDFKYESLIPKDKDLERYKDLGKYVEKHLKGNFNA